MPYHIFSVTRRLDCFSIFGHLRQWKLSQKCHKFAKVSSAFCQIRNKPLKFCQILVNFLPKRQNFTKSVHTAHITHGLHDSLAELERIHNSWRYLSEGEECFCMPNSQANLVTALHGLSLLFWFFINAKAHRLGWFQLSSNVSCLASLTIAQIKVASYSRDKQMLLTSQKRYFNEAGTHLVG